MKRFIEKYELKYFYPGHYWGNNLETPQRVEDVGRICRDVLDGKLEVKKNVRNQSANYDYIVDMYGVKVNYNESAKR